MNQWKHRHKVVCPSSDDKYKFASNIERTHLVCCKRTHYEFRIKINSKENEIYLSHFQFAWYEFISSAYGIYHQLLEYRAQLVEKFPGHISLFSACHRPLKCLYVLENFEIFFRRIQNRIYSSYGTLPPEGICMDEKKSCSPSISFRRNYERFYYRRSARALPFALCDNNSTDNGGVWRHWYIN